MHIIWADDPNPLDQLDHLDNLDHLDHRDHLERLDQDHPFQQFAKSCRCPIFSFRNRIVYLV